jgi:sugar lactone lactonase YvrE
LTVVVDGGLYVRKKTNWRDVMNRLPYSKTIAASSFAFVTVLAGCSEKGASRYEVSELVGPSAFHGIHGIAAAPDGKLLVGSVVGQAIYSVDPATGAVAEFIGPPNGMADDIAFAPDGTMAWTGFLIGKVFAQKPGGPIVEVATGLPGTNSLAFTKDGRLYFTQVFAGDALYEADVSGAAPPRKITENLGGLNGFEVGADGRIYGPLWFKGAIAAVDPKDGKIEVIVDGFKTPAAANFDSKGNLWAVDTAEGALYKIDVKARTKTKVADLDPALDNLAVDAQDRIYVTNMADNAVYNVDPATGTVTPIVKGKIAAAADLAIAHGDDGTLYLADIFSYRQIDTASGAVTTKARMFGDTLSYPSGVGVGPKHVVLASMSSASVQIIDRMSGETVVLAHEFNGPVDAGETADGRVLVLETGSGSLIALDDEKGEKRSTVASGFNQPVAFALDGKGAAYVTSSDGKVTKVDLASGAKTEIASGLAAPEGIDVAPDGRLVVAEVGGKRLVAIDPASGASTTLAEGLPIGLAAPAGQAPAFLTTGVAVDGQGTIYVSSDLTNAILKVSPAP